VSCLILDAVLRADDTDFGDRPAVSPRGASAPENLLLGTNCLGQGQCDGGYCNVNLTSLKTFVDQIGKQSASPRYCDNHQMLDKFFAPSIQVLKHPTSLTLLYSLH
jgi:hypothetical protein